MQNLKRRRLGRELTRTLDAAEAASLPQRSEQAAANREQRLEYVASRLAEALADLLGEDEPCAGSAG